MSKLKVVLKICGLFSLLLVVVGFTYQYFASKQDEKKYPPIGKMIDIGGYKLHMIDSQIGQFTVVIDGALGQKTIDWCLVQPEIAKFARVITYDRAGYAWSDVSPLARTTENIVQEMHTMLHHAKIPAPYILVGNGLGALDVRLFAFMYPHEVAGVILVDADHELVGNTLFSLYKNALRLHAANVANYLGLWRLLDCLPYMHQYICNSIEKYPAFLQRIYTTQLFTNTYKNSMTQEALLSSKSYAQLRHDEKKVHDKPLTVISYDTPDVYYQGIKPHKIWSELQADLVKKSSIGQQIIIKNSGNDVAYDQPQVIINAVRQMVNQLSMLNK